jgi:hypothetical protein
MDAVPELDGRTHAAACWRRDEVVALVNALSA